MAKSGVEGTQAVVKVLSEIPAKFLNKAKQIIDLNARLLQRYIREEKMTGGTTDTRLRVRSGRLRASVIPIKAEVKETRIEGGVSIGTIYGRVHVGPVGQVTTMTPKKGKYLTIPLSGAMTKSGVSKGSARSEAFGETFVAKSKAGNLIIFGKKRITKGKKAGELRSQVIPLFLLLKSVKVKARIHPQELISWIEPKMREDFTKKGIKVV